MGMSFPAPDLKQQRDQFLAFAFASSDLLMEIGLDGQIKFALGAAKGLTGDKDSGLMGRDWLNLFSKKDRPMITSILARTAPGNRCGPILVELNPERVNAEIKAVLCGLRMPGNQESLYVTLSHGNVSSARLAHQERGLQEQKLLDKETFAKSAQEAIALAKSVGEDVDVTFIDLAQQAELQKKLTKEQWDGFVEKLNLTLRSRSVDGQTAADLGDGRYGVLHDKSVSAEDLQNQIREISQSSDPTGHGLKVETKTVEGNLSDLSEREASMALLYTINEFQKQGQNFSIGSLNQGFDSYVFANMTRVQNFKQIIAGQRFDLAFQPVVDLNTFKESHYEILVRFEAGKSPYELITFGESIGLAPDFDLALIGRCINFVVLNEKGKDSKFAANISGLSIQNEQFFKTLCEKLQPHKDLGQRLKFEITESTEIKDLDQVNGHVKTLQKMGYQVCLDDFGAGSASFQYLHKLHVDFVKIDGAYSRSILNSERDAAMIKNLTQMCHDIGVKVVAEMVENKVQSKMLQDMGVQFGQGYLFGKPEEKPNYDYKVMAKKISGS